MSRLSYLVFFVVGVWGTAFCKDGMKEEKNGDEYVELAAIVGDHKSSVEKRRAALDGLVKKIQKNPANLEVLGLCRDAFSQAELSVIGSSGTFAGQWPFEKDSPLDNSLVVFVFKWRDDEQRSVVYFLIEGDLQLGSVKSIISDDKNSGEDKAAKRLIKKVSFFNGEKERK